MPIAFHDVQTHRQRLQIAFQGLQPHRQRLQITFHGWQIAFPRWRAFCQDLTAIAPLGTAPFPTSRTSRHDGTTTFVGFPQRRTGRRRPLKRLALLHRFHAVGAAPRLIQPVIVARVTASAVRIVGAGVLGCVTVVSVAAAVPAFAGNLDPSSVRALVAAPRIPAKRVGQATADGVDNAGGSSSLQNRSPRQRGNCPRRCSGSRPRRRSTAGTRRGPRQRSQHPSSTCRRSTRMA